MRIQNYYVIWCDSPLSRSRDGKIEYFVFKGKYTAKIFFRNFKKLKKIQGISNNYQNMDMYDRVAIYRSPFDDGFVTYENNLREEEKNLIDDVLSRFERLDGLCRSHKQIIGIIKGNENNAYYV